MKIELKNVKTFEAMSEETLAYVCDIFVDGVKAGYVKNDGHGGCSNYNAYEGKRDLLFSAVKTFESGTEFEYWIDGQVEDIHSQKQIDKSCKKGICYGKNEYYEMVHWVGQNIEKMLSTEKGREAVQKACDKIKANGQTILNKNLIGINI